MASPANAAHEAPYTQSIAGCLSGAIGAHGLSKAEFARWLAPCATALEGLAADCRSDAIPILNVPRDRTDITEASAALDRLSEGADLIVFYGTGGSSLGGQTLAQLGGWDIPGEFRPGQKQRPRVRCYDNLDPRTLERSLASLDLARTRFVVTSKSGGTGETLIQIIAALSLMIKRGLQSELPRLVLGITEPAVPGRNNGLRALLGHFNIPMLEHPTGVGGRYSALTNVGLLPAMAMGLDAVAVRQGAQDVIAAMLAARTPADCPPALGAALAIGLAKERGIGISVMMPYSDRLARFAHWYVQLWAESLGKSGEGTTPLAALGPVDQHSQLQLYMDGPREHVITVLRMAEYESGPIVDAPLARIAGFDVMAGRTAGDLVAAQSHAVPAALIAAGRPVRIFDLPRLDERTLGALMMHFMLETMLAARLLGIDAFDQPDVEAGKRLTLERLAGGQRA